MGNIHIKQSYDNFDWDQLGKTNFGVFREKEKDDVEVLTNYFTAPALAKAFRDRELTLQLCATLAKRKEYKALEETLAPFLGLNVMKRRNKERELDFSTRFSRNELVILQRTLHRMPRQVYSHFFFCLGS